MPAPIQIKADSLKFSLFAHLLARNKMGPHLIKFGANTKTLSYKLSIN